MNIIVLDTETSGLPIQKKFNDYYDPIFTKYYDSSRIIEIGYIIYTHKQEEMRASGKNEYVLTKNEVENYSKEHLAQSFNPYKDEQQSEF